MKVRFPLTAPLLTREDERTVTAAIRSGWITHHGKYVAQFERQFAAFSGASHGVATASGTGALHLALRCLNIGAGDEVITPTLTYVATASAIVYTGAAPVFVDVERNSWCIDPDAVERAITRRTKAIMAVHLYGQPADMQPLRRLARKRGIALVADAAQAHGSTYHRRGIAADADMTVFSFHGSKLVTTGEGGMLVTSSSRLAKRAHALANHAADAHREYWHHEIGFNYRLTNIQAALGVSQLKRVRAALANRRLVMQWYREFLSGDAQLEMNPSVPGTQSSFWLACVLLPDGRSVSKVRSKLAARGIQTRPVFPPVHAQPPFRGYRAVGACPISMDLSARGIALPTGSHLHKSDVRTISNVLLAALA